MDPGRGGVGGVLLREARSAGDLSQSFQNVRLGLVHCQTIKIVLLNFFVKNIKSNKQKDRPFLIVQIKYFVRGNDLASNYIDISSGATKIKSAQ